MPMLSHLHATLPGWRLREAARQIWRRTTEPAIERVSPKHTLVTREALKTLRQHVIAVDRADVPGDIVECGVAAGGSAAILGRTLTHRHSPRRLWLCDTFEGLPPLSDRDGDYGINTREVAEKWVGQCRSTRDEVAALLADMHVDLTRVVFLPGLFQDTLPHPGMRQIALLHIDGDWYESTRWPLTQLWPLVSPGGIVQVDDYNIWRGAHDAVEEVLAEHPEVEMRRAGGCPNARWFSNPVKHGA